MLYIYILSVAPSQDAVVANEGLQFIGIPEPKHVVVLVVTGILGWCHTHNICTIMGI